MFFDLGDHHPDTPRLTSSLTLLERVLLTIVVYLSLVILILIWPKLSFVQAAAARREQALAELRARELQRQRENAQFVFVQPRIDTPAPKPRPRADLSDMDRQARTTERAPDPKNLLPFSRGNTPERIEAVPPSRPERARGADGNAPPAPPPPPADPARQGLTLPDSITGTEQRASQQQPQPRGPAVGVIADAIRNVQKYAQKDGFVNLQGGADQDFAPSIQFDTKGVEFGPWLRRFVAQIRRNWFIPYAAMSMHGRVVLTFYVHKDGRITDLMVLRPSDIDAFTHSAYSAINSSNPTQPLPPEYPDERAFFTVTFFFNENPGTP
jgi:TonB family protein